MFGLHPSLLILIIAAICFVLSLIFYGRKDPKGSLREVAGGAKSAEDIDSRYRKNVFRMKLFFWAGFVLLFTSGGVWILMQLNR